MSTTYKPINCDFHELLLAKSTLKEECIIVYIQNNKEITTTNTIVDVFTRKGEEFMVLKTGETIRLDFIISVDDNQQPEFTCTFE